MTGYSIYVGLSDAITHKQIYETEKYIRILKNICKSYRVPFSFDEIQGGYIYENGDMESEVSLHISLYDQTEENVKAIAGDLCTFFHQESVMIVENEVKMYFVNGDSEVKDAINSLHTGK